VSAVQFCPWAPPNVLWRIFLMDQAKLFDTRIISKHINKKLVSEKDYNKFLESLKDYTYNSSELNIEGIEEEDIIPSREDL